MGEHMLARRKRPVMPTQVSAEAEALQRAPAAPQHETNQAPPIVDEVLQSSGQPLDEQTRAFMEPRFGHDFSQVRVHTDERAAESATAVNALAYTVGQDIVLGAGQFAPGTGDGQHVIAHELAHVVQQASGPVAGTPIADNMRISDPHDSFEQTAEQITGRVMAVSSDSVQRTHIMPLPTSSQAGVILQRQVDTQPSTQTAPPQTTGSPGEVDPNTIWNEIEMRATPELLIKLQEIGRAAGVQTKEQINKLFEPYEDSLEADHTFLEIMGIGPGGAGHLFHGGAGGYAGAAAEATKVVMDHILDFKSVGKVKTSASASVEDLVMTRITSGNDLYLNFESEALIELRQDFDRSWAAIPPEQRTAMAVSLVTHWFSLAVRTKYGVESPTAQKMLTELNGKVAEELAPIKTTLDGLQEAQKWKRVEAGALGGAVTGAGIGFVVGGPVGALIGAGIGAVVGGVAGYFWP